MSEHNTDDIRIILSLSEIKRSAFIVSASVFLTIRDVNENTGKSPLNHENADAFEEAFYRDYDSYDTLNEHLQKVGEAIGLEVGAWSPFEHFEKDEFIDYVQDTQNHFMANIKQSNQIAQEVIDEDNESDRLRA